MSRGWNVRERTPCAAPLAALVSKVHGGCALAWVVSAT
jgi:hypothetical protein